jgi:adenylate cyclase
MSIKTILESIQKIREFLKAVWLILSSGIRAKLAWFTGSLIALTIVMLSLLTVKQQTEILTESYEKQAAVSRNFIAGLVLEIENISQNLIRIEEFRNRIARQREELKKYRTESVVEQKKSVTLFGFKTNLFGTLGKETVTKHEDTFYSTYLTNSEVLLLERKTREQLNQAGKRPLTDVEWKSLQNLAKQFVESQANGISIQSQIEEKKEKLPATERSKLEDKVRLTDKLARKSRAEIDQKIAMIFASTKKRKLVELGLDTDLFRIQTFPLFSGNTSEIEVASFDTKILDPNSKLSGLLDTKPLEKALKDSISEFSKSLVLAKEGKTAEIVWKEREIQALHSPLFRNPASTKRAQNLFFIRSDLGEYHQVVKDDLEATKTIQGIVPKLRSRIAILKRAKPPIPPFRDKEFKKLYALYSDAIEVRNQSFDFLALEKQLSPETFELKESMRSVRDSALEDWILLKFKTDLVDYDHYYQNYDDLVAHRARWKALRLWISEATSETPKDALKKLFPDGTLAHSRSEAEEILWKLDTTPLFGEDNQTLSREILKANFSGLIRTLVDRTDGIHAIQKNRNQVILSAFTICFFAIVLAVFISGVVVQKIKHIISSAEDVGRGNLDVVFEHGGNDEFGNLTVSLNQMVSGLHERDKMRGVLGSMVDPVVVGEALKDLESLKRGSEKIITAFFSDIAGFSSISERLTPFELASLLNEYLSAMTLILKEYDGVLDKYIGDAIVGIFNAPIDVEDHCLKAVYASLAMEKRLNELKIVWKEKSQYVPEVYTMSFRIGLNTGSSKVGFMGTDALASYTMMGDTVNLAARLEAAGKDYGVCILASEAVFEIVKDKIFARKLDLVRVKGKSTAVVLYEIICRAGEETESQKQFVNYYEEGLFAYINRFWSDAILKLQLAEKTKGVKDIACAMLQERCQSYLESPPPSDWDGVFTRTHK